jgi:hypothetical protein
MDKHCDFCEQGTSGPWRTEDNHKTGQKELWGSKNIYGTKIADLKSYSPEDLDFIVHSKELLPRYVDALQFLVDCYEAATGSTEIGKNTMHHVEKILQGTD